MNWRLSRSGRTGVVLGASVFTVLIVLSACTGPLPENGDERIDTENGRADPPEQNGLGDSPVETTAPPPAVADDRRWTDGAMQYGVQVYVHAVGDNPGDGNTEAILDYVVGLGANAIGFNFPLYTEGITSAEIFPGEETPDPATISRMVNAATARGLRVAVRPLIDEEVLQETPGGWRGNIEPTDVGQWFQSYTDAIMPYVVAAAEGADEFVLASELTSMHEYRDRWAEVKSAAAAEFAGALSFTFNWDAIDAEYEPMADLLGLDLYFDVDLDDSAGVEEISAALAAHLRAKPESLRTRMVAQEVGIAGQSGMYRHPWLWGDPSGEFRPEIQANWFAAACSAVQSMDLQGIYFWMVDGNTDPLTLHPDSQPPSHWVGRPAEESIRDCFSGPLKA